MKTIQYGWRGEWHNMSGHGCKTVEEMEASISRMNTREGYERMRVADESLEGEVGAPLKPIHEMLPMSPDTFSTFMDLVRRSEEGIASEEDRQQLRTIMDATKGPVIGYEEARQRQKPSSHPENP